MPGLDFARIAAGSGGLAGADLASLLNEAALLAVRTGAPAITDAHLSAALDRMLLGAERKGLALSAEDRRKIAVHEAGHALAALLTPGADALSKVTVLPRGRSLGAAHLAPPDEGVLRNAKQLKAGLVVLAAGRAAEEAVFPAAEATTGAAGDLAAMKGMTESLVTRYGLAGPAGALLLPTAEARASGFVASPQLLGAIEEVERGLREAAMRDAAAQLNRHRRALDALAAALLEHETLDASEVRAILADHPPVPATLAA
ncbi:hypothetical protein ACE7GA_22140 [Roseomonas sp. CCTCC AB2023176]|uniref:hypothetical protein n=1 Tax=Roseomonas sp. CCTCC AB2023176 TaxID=3342640 RepID=UPI0035E31194